MNEATEVPPPAATPAFPPFPRPNWEILGRSSQDADIPQVAGSTQPNIQHRSSEAAELVFGCKLCDSKLPTRYKAERHVWNVHMRDKNSALLEPYSAYHKATVMPHITAPPNLPERKPLHKPRPATPPPSMPSASVSASPAQPDTQPEGTQSAQKSPATDYGAAPHGSDTETGRSDHEDHDTDSDGSETDNEGDRKRSPEDGDGEGGGAGDDSKLYKKTRFARETNPYYVWGCRLCEVPTLNKYRAERHVWVKHVRWHIGMPKSMRYSSRFKHLVTPYIVPPAQEDPNANALQEAVRKNRKLTILVNELKEELAEAGRQKKEYAAASKENERLRERLAALETQFKDKDVLAKDFFETSSRAKMLETENQKLREYVAELEGYKTVHKALSKEAEALKKDIGRFKAKNEALIATIKELEGQQATPKKQRPA